MFPLTSDELSLFEDGAETEVEFDDDYAVHGGPEVRADDLFSPTDDRREEEEEQPTPPVIAEKETCDADVEEEHVELPRSRRRRGRKKRWLRNMLEQNPRLRAVVAAVTVPMEHAEQHDKDAMQQVSQEEGKIIVPPAKVRASVGPELERWKLASEGELTNNFLKQELSMNPLRKRSNSMEELFPCCVSGLSRSRRTITSVELVCAVILLKLIRLSRVGPPKPNHRLC